MYKINIIQKERRRLIELWYNILQPFNHLSSKEISYLTELIDISYRLEVLTNGSDLVLNQLHLGIVRDNLSLKRDSNILNNLRDKGVIKDDKIIKSYLPKFDGNKIVMNFNLILDGQ